MTEKKTKYISILYSEENKNLLKENKIDYKVIEILELEEGEK